MPPSIDELSKDYEAAINAAAQALKDACTAANAASATGSGTARDHFKELEGKALGAFENWREASNNLWQRLSAV